jgi:hypothetical protein
VKKAIGPVHFASFLMGRIMTQNGTKIRENFKHPAMQAASTIFFICWIWHFLASITIGNEN